MSENPEAEDAEPQLPFSGDELLSARQACALLGIKAATLYTYVSRGTLQPVRPSGHRVSLFRRQDLEGLLLRSTARSGHGAVAAQAMHFGQPVLTSSITEITPQGPRYRGHLATELVRLPGTFESVCELLWSGSSPSQDQPVWAPVPMHIDIQRALDGMAVAEDATPRVLRMFTVAATALDSGVMTPALEGESSLRGARQLLFAFAGCCGMLSPARRFLEPVGTAPLAEHVLRALCGTPEPTPEALHVVNAALILGADHELASPTFAARIAASVGSNLHACVVAALATQRGAALAGGGDAVEDLLRNLHSDHELHRRLSDAAKSRHMLAGFNQPLYPQGDPRAAALMALARSSSVAPPVARRACHFIDEVTRELGLHPNIEVGLVALSMAWRLPLRTGSALWGIGRTAGWIAHVLEQRREGVALRPRGLFRRGLDGADPDSHG